MPDPASILVWAYEMEALHGRGEWIGPFDYYEEGRETLVAQWEGEGDGLTSQVFVTAGQYRRYRLIVHDGLNSLGYLRKGFDLETNNATKSMFEAMVIMAMCASEGTLVVTRPAAPEITPEPLAPLPDRFG